MTGRGFEMVTGGLVVAALLALVSFDGAMARDVTGQELGASPSTPVSAQGACPAAPSVLPSELSGWNRRVPLPAGRDASSAGRLQLGVGVDGQLSPTPEVRYALRPEKPGGSVSFGGIYAFTVSEAGRYRVALGSAAWIDVIKTDDATKGLTSIAHGHGPDCTGIRKMVDFALEPGDYFVQVSANGEAKLPLLVTRLP